MKAPFRYKTRRLKPIELPPPGEPPEVIPPMPTRLTPAELEEIATYIFGSKDWRSPLARAVGVKYRTVVRWMRGESPIEGPVIPCLWLLTNRHPLQTGAYLNVPTEAQTHRSRAKVRHMPKVRQIERFLLP